MYPKRLAFFFWEGHIGVAPSIINAVRLFAEKGYYIDIFSPVHNSECIGPPMLSHRVSIHTCDILYTRISRFYQKLIKTLQKIHGHRKEPGQTLERASKKVGTMRKLKTAMWFILLPMDFALYLIYSKKKKSGETIILLISE